MLRDTVPLTHPFALILPTVMELITDSTDPFPAMVRCTGEPHHQHRPIAVTDTVSIRTRAQNMREHRKGLLVDVLTDVAVATTMAWTQVTTFCTSSAPACPANLPEPGSSSRNWLPLNAILRITPARSGATRRWAGTTT